MTPITGDTPSPPPGPDVGADDGISADERALAIESSRIYVVVGNLTLQMQIVGRDLSAVGC